MIHVETLQKTPEGVRAFLALPRRLYRKDPYWVPPMRRIEYHHLIGAPQSLAQRPARAVSGIR